MIRRLRLLRRLFDALASHAGALCVGLIGLTIGLGLVARTLVLRTDVAELLPADHPAVVALRTVSPRQRSASNLVILIEAPDAARAAAFADALRPPLEALRPGVLSAIDWSPDGEPAAFAAQWKWLYASLADLLEVERLADRLVARHDPLYVDLEDEADGEDPATALRRLETRLGERLPAAPRQSRFARDDGKLIGVRVWRRRDGLGGAGDHRMIAAVNTAIAAARAQLGPRADGVLARLTGPIAQTVAEQDAIREDLGIATAVCVALVLGVLVLAFGNASLVVAALVPTGLGLLVALALAATLLGSLNLNTAFLISILIGNGINAPIVLLAELRRGGRAHEPLERALWRAWLRSSRGVFAAMISAALAYAVLGATRFRGFQQFGLIGGVGMVAVLLATYLALPPCLLWWDRRRPGALQRGRDRFSPVVLLALGWLATPRRAWLIAGALTIASTVGVVRFAQEPIEWNLRRLRSVTSEAGRLWPKMEELGMGSVGAGHIANTAVLLVDDARDAERVAAALLAQDRGSAGEQLLAEVRTIESFLPTQQADKLVVLGRLRARLDRLLADHGAALSPAQRAQLADARPPDTLRPITLDDLPRTLQEAFTEIDGVRGRLIGIDADAKHYREWDGRMLLRLARALRVTVDGKSYIAASAATVFAGMLETLLADAPRLSALALGTVSLLLVIVFGRRSPLVLLSLGGGLFWLAGFAGLFGLKLNFMSFAAIPISIGVGADYSANLWARLPDADADRRPAPVAATVVLCSLTTLIGYSTLLLGRNGALRSFGLLCDLGEVTCVLAAVLSPTLLRPLVRFFAPPPCRSASLRYNSGVR